MLCLYKNKNKLNGAHYESYFTLTCLGHLFCAQVEIQKPVDHNSVAALHVKHDLLCKGPGSQKHCSGGHTAAERLTRVTIELTMQLHNAR